MELTVFTPLPPCISFIEKDMMSFCNKSIISEEEKARCNTFLNEMTLDSRINTLRENDFFKHIVPEEESHTVCLWLIDQYGGFYSPGKMVIDDSYLRANGADSLLKEFRKSLKNEGLKPFEYVYSTKDNTLFGDFLLLLRYTLEMQGFKPSQKTGFDSNVINIIDERVK